MDPRTSDELRARHERLLAHLRDTASAHGHDPDRLRIVAITKTHPVAVVRSALEAGLRVLGENRVKEAEEKIAAVPEAEWHLVGHLQANKVRRALRLFPVIHSIDSEELLTRVDRIASEEGVRPRLLVQVNVSGEATKAGMAPADLEVLEPPSHADLVGLMTIAPMDAGDAAARAVFAELRALRDRLAARLGIELPELSMGMSGDADAAAAEGATLVRSGTALFGPRA